jgi:hypothetical protein
MISQIAANIFFIFHFTKYSVYSNFLKIYFTINTLKKKVIKMLLSTA